MGKQADALKLHDDAITRLDVLGGAKGSRDVRHLTNKTRLERAITWSRIEANKADWR